MVISDGSSDVCSSDLRGAVHQGLSGVPLGAAGGGGGAVAAPGGRRRGAAAGPGEAGDGSQLCRGGPAADAAGGGHRRGAVLAARDRKRGVWGKVGAVRVVHRGLRTTKKYSKSQQPA